MSMKQYIERCLEGIPLTAPEASAALELIMTNQATDAQIAGLLVALRARGETVEELVGFARTMREKAVRVKAADPDTIDMCGTGGDGLGTFNISTVAALVAAGAGVSVAKHGNRSVSSRSGSADVLTALGVNIQIPPGRVQDCLDEVGVGFLFAPLFHPAMKYAARPRVELGIRTIFNMIGPLTNPAGVTKQVVGAFSPEIAAKLAGALNELAAKKACVVHSIDGMDEVSVSGETRVCEVNGSGSILNYSLMPGHFGVQTHPPGSVSGGTAEENATIALRVLGGEKGPARDVVLANAALGIHVSGKGSDLIGSTAMAAASIDSGRAANVLKKLVEFTNRT